MCFQAEKYLQPILRSYTAYGQIVSSLPFHQRGWMININDFKGNILPVDQGPILEGIDSD